MPVLYHHPMSTASRFVRLIFSEYGVQSELIEEQIWEKRKDFLTLNPAGTLPVYVDDNMRALCGATIISEFLDETSGVLKRDRRLLAEDPFQRAEIRRLTEWFLFKMEQDVTRPLVKERVLKLQMAPDQGGGAPDSKILRSRSMPATATITMSSRASSKASPACWRRAAEPTSRSSSIPRP
jgi:glutathione S-transferase